MLLVLLLATTTGAFAAAEPPHILVIGATAKASRQIIAQALERGWTVTGLARQPGRVPLQHERLSLVQGDVYQLQTLEEAMTGREVVISMIAPRVDPGAEIGQVDLFTVGTANIMTAMKNKGNRRLLVASSLGVEEPIPEARPDSENLGKMWIWNARFLYRDMATMERLVANSGIDYVILRPPFLVEEPMQSDVKISIGQNSPKGRMLAYADFAQFVLDQVESDRYLNEIVGLYTDRKLEWGGNVDFDALAEQSQQMKTLEAQGRE